MLMLLVALCTFTSNSARAVAPFTLEQVDGGAGSVVGEYSSLRLDRSGRPHIAYYDGVQGDLKYASFNGTAWTIETADGSPHDVGQFTSLALDTLNRPHIAYYDESIGKLRYATKVGTTWTHEIADSASFDCGWYTSITLDSFQRPWIASYDRGAGNPRLSIRGASGWTGQYVDTSFNMSGFYISLALDAGNNPHVAYYDLTTTTLIYSRLQLGSWIHEIVESSANDVGLYCSLAIDRFGRVHLSYLDLTNGRLRYARRDPWQGGGWLSETVQNGPDIGYDCALTLDPTGWPNISYHDGVAGDLRFARRDGTGWHTQTVDDSPNIVGLYTSIATDASGNLSMSYWDGTDFTLHYARGPSQVLTDTPPAAHSNHFSLSPNPARAGARVRFTTGEAGVEAVYVFDLAGRRLARVRADASGTAEWDTHTDRGTQAAPGLYFVRPARRDGSLGEVRRLALVH
jgi:hypothetical protein